MGKLGRSRNYKCYCESGKKYKKCCMNRNQGFVKKEEGWMRPEKPLTVEERIGTLYLKTLS